MQIDLIAETGIAAGIGRRQIIEHDRRSIRENDPLPDEEDAVLPVLAEGDDVVVFADQACALRDQQEAAGDAVEDVLGDLRDDEAREIGVEPRDQAGGNDRSRPSAGRARAVSAARAD
jgi:hypothetical protein